MATILSSPKLVTFDPVVYNTGGQVYISLPVGNAGTLSAPGVLVTGITLGTATRTSPLGLPVSLGDIAVSNRAALNFRFAAASLTIGKQALLTVRGTYRSQNVRLGFTVNRYIVVPSATTAPVALLQAHVTPSLESAVWNYSVTNDQPAGSSLQIASFTLDVANAVTVTGTPHGWAVQTDNMTNVFWYSLDQNLPYATHIAPGHTLSGFQIQCATAASESTSYVLTSWDHAADAAGLVSFDYALSPARAS